MQLRLRRLVVVSYLRLRLFPVQSFDELDGSTRRRTPPMHHLAAIAGMPDRECVFRSFAVPFDLRTDR